VYYKGSATYTPSKTWCGKGTAMYSSFSARPTADSVLVGYPDIQEMSYTNAGLPKWSDFSSYFGDQYVIVIGILRAHGSNIDKNGISKSSFQRVNTSGLKQSTRIRASCECFNTFKTRL